MKLFIAFCLLVAALVLPVAAQTENTAEKENPASRPAAAAAEPMREDERITFMEESGNSAYASSNAPGSGGLIVRTLGALCLVGGLIFAAAWGLKKFGGFKFGKEPENAAAAAAQLTVLSSVTLGANRTLSVVRFGEQTLLVGTTPQSIALLATQDSAREAAAAGALPVVPRSVAEMLAEDERFLLESADANNDFSFDETLAAVEETLLENLQATERSKTI